MLVRAVRLFAYPKSYEVFTDRHTLCIILVQKTTVLPKSTDSFQPVSADGLQSEQKSS